MPFQVLAPGTVKSQASVCVSLCRRTARDKDTTVLSFSFSGALVKQIGWKLGDLIEIAVGDGPETGYVRLRPRIIDWSMPIPECGCWIWMKCLTVNFGYGHMNLGGGLVRRSHRVSYEVFRGQIPNGLCVLHKCDIPSCVNPDHLFLGTRKDNYHDMRRKGRFQPVSPRGERNVWAKLTEAAVREIRASRERQIDIARRFGVASSTIRGVLQGKTWRHVA